MHERGLADARVAGDEDDLAAALERALERGGERLDVVLAAVELLVDPEQGPGDRAGPRRSADRPRCARRAVAAALEVGEQALGALVAVLGVLREQLEHDAGDGLGMVGSSAEAAARARGRGARG